MAEIIADKWSLPIAISELPFSLEHPLQDIKLDTLTQPNIHHHLAT
jgi:hypothetical protein